MRTHFELVTFPLHKPSEKGTILFQVTHGACVSFLGIVRDLEGGKKISGIEYEAYSEMAVHQFNLIFSEVSERWSIESIHVIHRVGVVLIGEPSLSLVVVGCHRAEAFAACQFVIDQMKVRVPIWKRPLFLE